MLWFGGTELETALSAGPWATWPAAAWGKGALLGVLGADAGEAAFDPMNDTGVLQPEWGWEPIWGTEPGFITGAGEAEADGGLDPPGWLLPATKKNSPYSKISFVLSWSWENENKFWFYDPMLKHWAIETGFVPFFRHKFQRPFHDSD